MPLSVFSCYCHRSHPSRSGEEDDNSPHRREQQQHLEFKAIVWVSSVTYLCVVFFPSKISVYFLHFNQFFTNVACDLNSALYLLCGRNQFTCGLYSILPLIRFQSWGQSALLSAWTLADCHLTTFYLNMDPRFYRCNREGQLSPQAFTSLKVEDREEKASV